MAPDTIRDLNTEVMDNAGEAGYDVRGSSNVVHERVSIKHGDCFVVCDRRGDILRDTETGFYAGGTRYLSQLELRAAGDAPVMLSSSLSDDDVELAVVQTNARLSGGENGDVPRQAVLFARELTVADGRLLTRIEVRSFHVRPLTLDVKIDFDADFVDIFEVRGYKRPARGERLPPIASDGKAVLTYRGLDDVVRRTIVAFDPAPRALDGRTADFLVSLAPGEAWELEISVSAGPAQAVESANPGVHHATEKVRREQASWERTAARFFTSSERLNRLLDRSSADLRLMCTKTEDGLFPYAGIPWYACPFGRDSLWTGLMTLPLMPRIASGTLRYLANRQADRFDDFVDSEPGKILHEMRTGEMANLREIPFIPYYGTVDATPLFVVLLDRYVRWTGDRDLVEQLWPNAKRALDWVRGPGDLDGDGFLEYRARNPGGLTNQGWKDSSDSVFHRDGTLAEGPIALVEAQAYAFAALRAGSRLAEMQGEGALAKELTRASEALRVKFEEAFWCHDRGFYAIALDGKKRRCEVISSNPGHALWAGICAEDRAEKVADVLLAPAGFCGWGVRTIADGEARYNPMSYHDGSVWPHDNAILVYGLKRYGLRDAAARVAAAVLDAGQQFDDYRIPELFCGFTRHPRAAPTPYPVACRPQAWASATVFAMVEAMLGLEVDGIRERVSFTRPSLPHWLDWIEITNLAAGSKRASVRLERTPRGGATIARAVGDAKVSLKK